MKQRDKRGRFLTGHEVSYEMRRKIGEAQIGEKNHMFGKSQSEESNEKRRLSMGTKQTGENNPGYKDNKAGINAIHRWVERRKPKPEKCEECNLFSPMDLANVSGKYLRNLDDWRWLCRRCHMESHDRIPKIDKSLIITDFTGYRCARCNKDETALRKNGKPRWILTVDGYICNKCYMIEWHKKHDGISQKLADG